MTRAFVLRALGRESGEGVHGNGTLGLTWPASFRAHRANKRFMVGEILKIRRRPDGGELPRERLRAADAEADERRAIPENRINRLPGQLSDDLRRDHDGKAVFRGLREDRGKLHAMNKILNFVGVKNEGPAFRFGNVLP